MSSSMDPSIQSVPPLLIFFPIFLFIYLFSFFFLFKNWPPKSRPEAASCAISLSHGATAVLLAFTALRTDTHPAFAARNTHLQDTALDFSVAYFIMDLIHYLIFYPSDVLFIGHHLATLFVFLTCRFVAGHGAFAVLGLLILAEITSPLQNLWTLANARRGEVEFADRMYVFLSLPFYVLYSVARGIFGPYFVYRMWVFYYGGYAGDLIPKWIWVSWIMVVVAAISVSVLWIWSQWVEWFVERRKKLEEKLR